ncbi:MAG: TIGR01212 family radical SAM protein [Bacilli bacterium]|jgi:radical SAM protein (TIGR01212 family)|nr:TIGR01212 family radical SAM protein [Bacilli bacterium]
MFKYSLDNKRYHTLNYFYRSKFDSKVFKVSLNAGFSCPNFRNGKGCIFCKDGSGNIYKDIPLKEQFEIVKIPLEKKWPNSKYIAYFQANTNTYASVNVLKEKYESVLSKPNVVGLAIATRSDALSTEILDYLSVLNERTFLTVEIGLQSMHKESLEFIKRGHDLDNFYKAIKELKKRNIFVVVHIINGIPGETKEMMVDTVKYLNSLGIDGIKIHMLYISKGTELEEIYLNNPFHILTKDEYIDIVCEQLEYLDEKIVVERITGDPIKEELTEPTWLLKKFCVLNDIDKEMKKRDIYQGDKVNYS